MSEQSIDLDASALLFDGSGQVVDTVWYNQLVSRDGSVVHTGDNRTGAGDGDDESIKVDLSALPAQVQTVVFTVNSFTGQGFSQVENAFCRLIDEAGEEEIARYDLSATGSHTAQIMAKVTRDGAGWSMTAIGGTASGPPSAPSHPRRRSTCECPLGRAAAPGRAAPLTRGRGDRQLDRQLGPGPARPGPRTRDGTAGGAARGARRARGAPQSPPGPPAGLPVLGKHVPTDPRLVLGSGRLLGRLVAALPRGPGRRAAPGRPGGWGPAA